MTAPGTEDPGPAGTAPGGLPQSLALAEASPESLAELFSRDPEGYSDQDLGKVIEALRAQRVRWAAAEATPKPQKEAAKKAKSLIATMNPEDLGL